MRVLILVFLLLPSFAQARVFDFKNESFATYLKGTFGSSEVGETPFNESSGTSTKSFSGGITSNSSGEFGVLLGFGRLTLRLAAELLMPKHISDVKGYNAGEAELFNLETKVSAITPMAYIDLNLIEGSTSRIFAGGGVGYAYIKMENNYTMTSTGTSTYGGLTSFSERATGMALAAQAYAGFEFLFSDNVTVTFDGGYRYLPVYRLNHQNPTTTFLGSVSKGEAVQTETGVNRKINLSGAFGGVAFRFYF